MIEEKRTERKKYIFPCPRCRKQHCYDSAIFDDRVSCSCGFDFYAFACGDLRIVMPWDEASYEPIARALRKFVVATGRCQDIPPELYDDPFDCIPVLEEDIERAFMILQKGPYGKCYITPEMFTSICDSIHNGYDVEIKRKKNGIEIIELKKKTVCKNDNESKPFREKAPGSEELSKILTRMGLMFSPQPVDDNRIHD